MIDKRRYLSLLEYELALQDAEADLIRFAEITMPDLRRMDDPTATKYAAAAHHRFMADVMMQVEMGLKNKVILNLPPRHGKACSDDTPVLTPKGWVQHGDLKAGDTVYGPDGLPAKVLATTRWEPDMLDVEITNGEVICVHRNHEWTVECQGQAMTVETNWFLSSTKSGPKAGQPRDLWRGERGKRGAKAVYRLPPVSPIQFPDAILPAHPYALGAWLGDGSKDNARIVGVDDEVFDGMTACGYAASSSGVHTTTGVKWSNYTSGTPNVRAQLSKQLHDLGLIGKKRIPEMYLRASISQRLQLLAGLMDTDGHADPKGRCRIVTAESDLADDIFDLCSTLGFRPYRTVQDAHTSTSGVVGRRDTITIGFQPTMEIPCRVQRKRVTRFAEQRSLAIADVRPARASGCQSIHVDRPDGLYLVGKTLVPTHNSELCTKRFCAWYSGRHPDRDIIVATYNEKFAHDFSKEVREIMASPRFQQVFPDHYLVQQSDERLRTNEGGDIFFLGRRSSTTGRGADLLLVDDPTKDDKEVRYPAFREDCWQWFTQTLLTRRHNDRAPIVLTQTRWNDDDIVGRISDPSNPAYSEKFAQGFEIISLPAIAEEDDPLGRKPGDPLWPDRFGIQYLEEMREANAGSFAALYQCDPTPEEGSYYRAEELHEYTPDQLPDRLQIYVVSDHAVATKDINDPTCIVPFGICENGKAWILPSVVWRRLDGMQTVEEMLNVIRNQSPMFWYAEKGHISKALKPFLMKRMEEEGVYCPIIEEQPIGDKLQRATSARARCAQGMIMFPKSAPWWHRAKMEMLKFPNGRFDDFVDCLSMIGIKLAGYSGPGRMKAVQRFGKGTYGELLQQFKRQQFESDAEKARRGW